MNLLATSAMDDAPLEKTTPFRRHDLTLLSAKDFDGRTDIDWLIEGVLPRFGLASMYGASGSGKSFATMDLAASVAALTEWFGHRVHQTRVVVFVLEGQAGIPLRTSGWAKVKGMEFPAEVYFVFDAISLSTPKDVDRMVGLITEFNGAGLVIIDTLNRAASGADENSSVDMGKLIAGATALQRAIGGLVLLVHHSGKEQARGLRGHSSLHAALDAVIEVEREGDRRWWKLVKSKDGQDGVRHAFRLATVEIGANQFGDVTTSCAIEEAEDESIPVRQPGPRGVNQRTVLAAFRELVCGRQLLNADTDLGGEDGIAIDEAIDQLKDKLTRCDSKHRRERTAESIEGLVEGGYLVLSNGRIRLPLP